MSAEAVVLRLLDAVAARDFDAATACYADDARYHVRSWQKPVVGRAAIREEFRRQAGHFDSFRYDVLSILASGSTVGIERVDHLTMFGKAIDLHWVGVHEIGEDGLIAVTRDYFDADETTAQLA